MGGGISIRRSSVEIISSLFLVCYGSRVRIEEKTKWSVEDIIKSANKQATFEELFAKKRARFGSVFLYLNLRFCLTLDRSALQNRGPLLFTVV